MSAFKDSPWLRFFRVPNLPTVPGDALAGAAFMMPTGDATLPQAFAAAVGVLFMYMFGLADNDLADMRTDAVNAPDRPIPLGEISYASAMAAMCACLLAAWFLPTWIVRQASPDAPLPMSWTVAMTALFGCIYAYNRLKWPWLMGACRGMSVMCGGLAAWVPDVQPYARSLLPESVWLFVALCMLAMGWAAYIESVTKLSEGEERPSEGLGNRRFLLGLSAFLPLLGFVPIACSTGMAVSSSLVFALPVAGCCCTFLAWSFAVEPLWMAHGPPERRRAVGRTIGALIYMQIGFMLIVTRLPFLVAAAGIWLASWLVRRLFPNVSGS